MEREEKKPEWVLVDTLVDEEARVAILIRKLQVKKPVMSFQIGAWVDGKFMAHQRPHFIVSDDGQVENRSIADALARLTIKAEEFCAEIVRKDAAEFRAAREKWKQQSEGRSGNQPNNDPKELAKRKRREENLARRRDEDRKRASGGK